MKMEDIYKKRLTNYNYYDENDYNLNSEREALGYFS